MFWIARDGLVNIPTAGHIPMANSRRSGYGGLEKLELRQEQHALEGESSGRGRRLSLHSIHRGPTSKTKWLGQMLRCLATS